MNELTLLKQLNADVPAPLPEVVLKSRRALLRTALAPAPRRTAFRLRRVAVGAAVAVLLAGGLLVVQTVQSPNGATAQAALQSAARSAAVQTFAEPAPDQFMYVRTEASWAVGSVYATYLQPQLYEAWISVDGTSAGLVRKTFRAPVFLDPDDEAELIDQGMAPPPVGSIEEDAIPPQPPGEGEGFIGSYAYLTALPTDPDELFDLIRDRAEGKGQSDEQEMLVVIGDLLRFTTAPPAIRAALYEVASRVDGVELVADAEDFSGRQGTAVGITVDGLRTELIFDPVTSELLGTRSLVVDAQFGLEAGVVFSSDASVVTVVDSVPAN